MRVKKIQMMKKYWREDKRKNNRNERHRRQEKTKQDKARQDRKDIEYQTRQDTRQENTID